MTTTIILENGKKAEVKNNRELKKLTKTLPKNKNEKITHVIFENEEKAFTIPFFYSKKAA